jgi:LacI family transcriptional regulator
MKRYITLRDIAREVGVSVSTVSRAINNFHYVGEATREKILKAVAKLNYQPNFIARSLKGKGTKTIGVIIPDIRDSIFSSLVKSIETCAYKHGFNVVLCDAEGSLDEEISYIDTLLRKGIDGLVIAPVDMEGLYTNLVTGGIPYVQVDRKTMHGESDFIGIDNVKDAAKATDHLISHGYVNIGFIGYEQRLYTMARRLEGYQKAVREHGLPENYLLVTRTHGGEPVRREIESWLKGHRIDAVLCGNDDVCLETLAAIEKLNWKIPEDLGLLTFDDIE